jgi:hypothetical protein
MQIKNICARLLINGNCVDDKLDGTDADGQGVCGQALAWRFIQSE